MNEMFPIAEAVQGYGWASLILWLPALSTILCGLCAALRIRNKLPAWITVGLLGASFVLTLVLFAKYEGPIVIHVLDWFQIDYGSDPFLAQLGFYIDKLSLLWLLFVTGLGTLIALYASEYMESDVERGYARFFAGISVFLFSMIALVTGDNLVMLYLGWEGVGFASYWLIGYYCQRPSAVAAAKKAFIVNRIGDLGLALGLYLIWHTFNTVEYAELGPWRFRLRGPVTMNQPWSRASGSIPFQSGLLRSPISVPPDNPSAALRRSAEGRSLRLFTPY